MKVPFRGLGHPGKPCSPPLSNHSLTLLQGPHGLLSIDYRNEADDQSLKLAEAIAAESGDLETIETDYTVSDDEDLRTEPEE